MEDLCTSSRGKDHKSGGDICSETVTAMQSKADQYDCDIINASNKRLTEYKNQNDNANTNSVDESVLCRNVPGETSERQVSDQNTNDSIYEIPLLMEVEEGNKVIPEISPPNTRRKKCISCYCCMSQQCVCVKSNKNVKELKSKMVIGKRDTKHKKLQNTGSAAEVYQKKQCKNRTKTKSVVEKEDKEEDAPWQSRYVCRVCGSIFKEKVPWINHIERKHYHTYELQCDKCFLPFSNEYETSSHICTGANIRNHTCIFCSDEKSFIYKTNLYYHMMQEHDSKFPLRCEICAKPLASRLEQTQHIATHSCSTVMKNETHLKQFATEHQMQVQYEENGDDSTTGTKSRHSNKTETGAKTKNLPLCEYCGRVVKQLSVHTDVCLNNKYKCSTCEMTLNSKRSLTLHIMRFHTSEKPYTCNQCEKRYISNGSLKYHIRSAHALEKKYKCNFCVKQFVLKEQWNRHVRVHLQIKPFTCECCGRTFSTKWNMDAHMRQHTGDTPYKCSKCGKGFAHNVVRKSHQVKCDLNP